MPNLRDYRVAVLATDGFEELELTTPIEYLRAEGAQVEIASPGGSKIRAFKHHDKSREIEAQRKLEEIKASEFDAVVLPGGALNADALRVIPQAQAFVQEMNQEGKPIAVICHGPWLLVSAGLLKNRKITSWPTLADDIRNAGGIWEDREVIVDGNLVSSRKPGDLPAFCREMIALFARSKRTRPIAAA